MPPASQPPPLAAEHPPRPRPAHSSSHFRERREAGTRERAAPSQTPPGSAPCSLQCTTSPAPACCSLPLADPLCLCGSDAPAAAVRRRRARALTGGGAGRGRHAEAGATCPCFTATLSAGALSGAPHMVAISCPSYSPSSSALPLSAIHGGRQQRLAHRGWIIVDWLVCCCFLHHPLHPRPHLLILPPSSCLLQTVCNALMYHIEIALLCDMVAARGLGPTIRAARMTRRRDGHAATRWTSWPTFLKLPSAGALLPRRGVPCCQLHHAG